MMDTLYDPDADEADATWVSSHCGSFFLKHIDVAVVVHTFCKAFV